MKNEINKVADGLSMRYLFKFFLRVNKTIGSKFAEDVKNQIGRQNYPLSLIVKKTLI